MYYLSITAIVVSLTALTAFVAALRYGWLSNMKRGFLMTLRLSLVGTGLMSSLLVGLWCYESAKDIIAQGTIENIGNVGRAIEEQLDVEIDQTLARLKALSGWLTPSIEKGSTQDLQEKVRSILQVNADFLQADVYDKDGRLLAGAAIGDTTEPLNRVAAAYGIEGKDFVSDPYMSSVFGKYVLYLSVPLLSSKGEIEGVLSSRVSLESISNLLVSTRFGQSGYAVIVNHDGLILGHPDHKRINEDLSGYRAVQLGLKGNSGSVVDLNKAGQRRLFYYRALKGPGTVNPQPMVIMSEMDEREAVAPLITLKYQFFVGMALIALACLIVAQQLSNYIKRPFQELLHMFDRVQKGDLSVQTEVRGRDEIAQLEVALNGMVEGLRERNLVKELFGRYVTTQVSEEVLKGRINLGGESRRVTILFSDIRNFTSTAEDMEPTQVVAFLNEYFSEMVEAVFEYGGVLDKFMGDGMMAVFGSFGDEPDHPRRAIMAGLRMKALLGKINGQRSMVGKAPIKIGVGIHTDEVIVGNIGSQKRLEYTVIGDGVNTCSRVESLNKEFGTTILITSTTYNEVQDLFECRQMPQAQLKGKARALQFYEVLSLKT